MLSFSTKHILWYTVLSTIGIFSLPSTALPYRDSFTPLTGRQAQGGSSSTQVLARNGEGDFEFYRIVALADLGEGVVLASYDGRPDGADSPSPNSILQRRSTDGGDSWGPPTYIAKGQPGDEAAGKQQYGFSDPSYVVDRTTGRVFNFHVFSKNRGFHDGAIGNDDTDLDVTSAEVSVSTDGGVSWSTDPENQPDLPPLAGEEPGSPPLITRAVKPTGKTVDEVKNVGGIAGMFATSGEGIQLRYGPHAGRLVQQFVGDIVQPDGKKEIQAYSVFSDDGGDTWKMGTPVGQAMDENKVVELSNGDVMLNSRPNKAGYRKVAISTDGGETYSMPKEDTQLPDPANNGHITRMYPDANEGSKEAQILLFTNTATKDSRDHGTIRYSCNDGKKWSEGRLFREATTSYSTVTPLGGDQFGIFFEGDGELLFAKVDKEWIGVDC